MIKAPTEAHIAYMEALKQALTHVADTPSQEILAIASQYLGMLLAGQDRTRYTAEQYFELIMNNIEMGNQRVVNGVGHVRH